MPSNGMCARALSGIAGLYSTVSGTRSQSPKHTVSEATIFYSSECVVPPAGGLAEFCDSRGVGRSHRTGEDPLLKKMQADFERNRVADSKISARRETKLSSLGDPVR